MCPGATHHAWPWVGHPALVGTPLVVGALPVGKGAVEHLPDVGHAVHTDSGALEDVAEKRQRMRRAEPFSAPVASGRGVGAPTSLRGAGQSWQRLGSSPVVMAMGQVMGSGSWMSPEAETGSPT